MVVVDSSTLIHLSAIGRCVLLKELFGTLTLPPAVWREVVEQGRDRAGVGELEAAYREGWLEIRAPGNEPLLRSLLYELDEGEAEVIALAVEQRADLVLLDETEARRIASVFGLEKTGAIGVLIRAKLEGRIESLRVDLDRIRTETGFWVEESLYERVLRSVGE
jgi:predicted nucleic acid-binding protein